MQAAEPPPTESALPTAQGTPSTPMAAVTGTSEYTVEILSGAAGLVLQSSDAEVRWHVCIAFVGSSGARRSLRAEPATWYGRAWTAGGMLLYAAFDSRFRTTALQGAQWIVGEINVDSKAYSKGIRIGDAIIEIELPPPHPLLSPAPPTFVPSPTVPPPAHAHKHAHTHSPTQGQPMRCCICLRPV